MIRKATLKDLPFVISLARKAFSQYGRYEFSVAKWFFTPGIHSFVCTKDNGETLLCGFIMLAYLRDSSSRAPALEIMAIAVCNKHQRQGIGTELLNFALRFLQESWAEEDEIPRIRLSVAATNRARNFFRKFGFRLIGEADWQYPAGQKAFRMEKT